MTSCCGRYVASGGVSSCRAWKCKADSGFALIDGLVTTLLPTRVRGYCACYVSGTLLYRLHVLSCIEGLQWSRSVWVALSMEGKKNAKPTSVLHLAKFWPLGIPTVGVDR